MPSKFMLSELRKHGDMSDFDESGDSATLTIEEEELVNTGLPSGLTAEFESAEGTSTAERQRSRKRVSNAMANKLMDDFKSELQLNTAVNLKQLALVLAGATDIGGRKTNVTSSDYSLGAGVDAAEGDSHLLETRSGTTKRRASTLRPLLEELMKKYIVKDMTRPTAPLKFQSGRFANSAKLVDIKSTNPKAKRPKLSLVYTYMVRPYSVFDPAVSNYRGLSSVGRNPQRILGQALRNAAKDLLSAKYNLNIHQLRRDDL